MTTQVVPFITQADLFDPSTYKELGFWGAVFAISLMLLMFSIVKGYIKIIACGPNEGGIREFFGMTLWKVGPGPHLHVAGIFAVRKVSFAVKQINLVGQSDRSESVYDYGMGFRVRVRNDAASIRLRVYMAEDSNRGDAENEEAILQVESQLEHITCEALEADVLKSDIETVIKNAWDLLGTQELQGTTPGDRSTYGYEILSVDLRKLVERELSEVARALRSADPVRSATTVASLQDHGMRSA